jgi:hypothetical protein
VGPACCERRTGVAPRATLAPWTSGPICR